MRQLGLQKSGVNRSLEEIYISIMHIEDFLNLKGFLEFCSEYYPEKGDIIFDLKRYYSAGKLRYEYLKNNKIKDWFKTAGCVKYIGMRTYILDGLHIFKSGYKTLKSKV